MKLENDDDQLMAMAAFRYCLGRQTYMVGACLDWLNRTWTQFDRNTKRTIVRDIVAALMRGEAGHPTIDAPHWKSFAERAWEQLPHEDQTVILRSTAHIEGDWPLGEKPEECPACPVVERVLEGELD